MCSTQGCLKRRGAGLGQWITSSAVIKSRVVISGETGTQGVLSLNFPACLHPIMLHSNAVDFLCRYKLTELSAHPDNWAVKSIHLGPGQNFQQFLMSFKQIISLHTMYTYKHFLYCVLHMLHQNKIALFFWDILLETRRGWEIFSGSLLGSVFSDSKSSFVSCDLEILNNLFSKPKCPWVGLWMFWS